MRSIRLLVMCAALSLAGTARAQDIDWKQVDAAMGKTAAASGEVHRYGLPRSDLAVTLDGVSIKPAFALGGWVAFMPAHGGAVVMGDLVLTESEINPVMARLLESGLEVTALHNHLLRARPPTFYMHVGGHGDAAKMASAIHSALTMSATPLETATTGTAAVPAGIDLDTAKLDEIIGVKGQTNGGVYQVGVPRREAITEGGMTIPPPMGVAHAINFQPLGGGKAAITGDFVITQNEVEPLIRTLRTNGIEVTALHNHMLDEEPRIFFVHFWAQDDAVKLARGLREALNKTAIKE